MTIKNVLSGPYKGATAALATANREHVLLYTCPAGKKFVLREIAGYTKINTNTFFQLFILKSGGAAPATNNVLDLAANGTTLAQSADAVPVTAQLGGGVAVLLSRATVLNEGDALYMRLSNNTGGNFDTTTIGIRGIVSGDET